jgi:RNA recognition motif-containing protein
MNIYVGNMPFSMDENQVREEFGAFGEIHSAKVITDRDTGRSKGFAFVEMDDANARTAIESMNERQIDGRSLNVNEARPREGGGRPRY